MTTQIVVLYSGGMDSTVLLHMAKALELDPIALLINYQQKNLRELETAARICHNLGVPFRTMKIDLGGINSGLTGDKAGGQYADVSEWYVPGRNTIFIALAFSLAESVGATKIWYGANLTSYYNRFPDCVQEYVVKMNDVVKIAGSRPIELEAPLLGVTKATVELMAKAFGFTYEDVYSGYRE